MSPERWQRVEAVFESALLRPANERTHFLREACADDADLRREVGAMLGADQRAEGEFEKMAGSVAAEWASAERHNRIGETIGHYRILEPLGAGGMGEVFLARDTTLDRKVALKLLPQQFTKDRDRLRRFEQEARAASALNHPNIITIHEIGECDGTRFLAAEYVEGETLGELIAGPRRSTAETLELGCQAASALAAAHDAGIVHRDIKPANIMLRRDGFIKVLDFGLAKLTGSAPLLDVTEPGRVLGTINYMSPEQAMGRPLDHRTDIFSLGVVLYELGTGQRLFAGQSEAAVYDSILHKATPDPREFAPALPIEFGEVLRRALEKDPARRYQTATEFRADLKRLQDGAGKTEAALLAARERRTALRAQLLRYAAIALCLMALIFGPLFLWQKSARRTAAGPERKSIAVLPFANLSSRDENAYFTQGMHDQVLTDLAKIAQLKVIGRSSVTPYKSGSARDPRQIAQQLGATYLLEASVQRRGGRVRVNAQLIDGNKNEQVWAESYDRELADVFDIQSDLARAIAAQLQASLSPAEAAEIARKPSSNIDAFELYAHARELLDSATATVEGSEQNARSAINLLEAATSRDPGFALAYTELMKAHDFLYWTGIDHSANRLALGAAALEAATRLAPDAGATLFASAEHAYIQRDYARAQAFLVPARAKLPNEPRLRALAGYIFRRRGKWAEAALELEQAVALDPRNVLFLQNLGTTYLIMDKNAAAVQTLERARAIDPKNLGVRLTLANIQIDQWGNLRPMHELLETISREEPENARMLITNKIDLALYERNYE
nr:protein kinase [Verrucomicrobiota bacterium]